MTKGGGANGDRHTSFGTWSSAWARLYPDDRRALPLCNWPLPCPKDWRRRGNEPLTDGEIKAVRKSAEQGSRHGQRDWVEETAKALDLERTLGPSSRPRDQPDLDLPNASLSPVTISQLINSHDRGDGILPHLPGYPE